MDIFEAEVARRFVVAVEKIANALDRKTEPTISKMEQVDKDINVRSKDEPQTDNGIGCSRCEGRFDCYDRDMPHAVRCNNYGKITDEPQTERSE